MCSIPPMALLSRLSLAAVCGLGLSTSLQAQTEGFYRQPALQGQHVVFVAEGGGVSIFNLDGQLLSRFDVLDDDDATLPGAARVVGRTGGG